MNYDGKGDELRPDVPSDIEETQSKFIICYGGTLNSLEQNLVRGIKRSPHKPDA